MGIFKKIQDLFKTPEQTALNEEDKAFIEGLDFERIRKSAAGRHGELEDQNKILRFNSLIFISVVTTLLAHTVIALPSIVLNSITTEQSRNAYKYIKENDIDRDTFIRLGKEAVQDPTSSSDLPIFSSSASRILDGGLSLEEELEGSPIMRRAVDLLIQSGAGPEGGVSSPRELSDMLMRDIDGLLSISYDTITSNPWRLSIPANIITFIGLWLITYIVMSIPFLMLSVVIRFIIRFTYISIRHIFGRPSPSVRIEGRLFLLYSQPSPAWIYKGLAGALFGYAGWAITYPVEKSLFVKHRITKDRRYESIAYKYRVLPTISSGFLQRVTGCDMIFGSAAAIEKLHETCLRQGYSIKNNVIYHHGIPCELASKKAGKNSESILLKQGAKPKHR